MENKQIIINNVDVSGCDFLAKEDDYCSYSGEYRAYKGQCGCSDEEMCKDHPNCFYKKALNQLKCKEQECQQAMDNYVQLDLQRVKEYNELVDLYKVKEQECEELKHEVELMMDCASCKVDEYKQTLTEIKEIAENEIECKTYEIEHDCFNETRCKALNEHINFIKQILQKTTEV